MESKIPEEVMREAIASAQSDPEREVIGFFVMNAMMVVEWHLMENVSGNPERESQISAEAMAEMICVKNLAPLAMFHSHPSGAYWPSQNDLAYFPGHYVDFAYIWTAARPRSVTQYTEFGYAEEVRI